MPPAVTFPTGADAAAIAPLGVVALGGLLAILIDLVAIGAGRLRRVLAVSVGTLALAAAGVLLLAQYGRAYTAFGDGYIVGGYAIVLGGIIVVATAATLALTLGVGRDDQVAGTTALLLWSASGAMLMTGAGNLLTVFLGLETLSLALYALCAMSARATARESALKYLVLSSIASAVLLYGSALLFGATGHVGLAGIAQGHPSALLMLGWGLFLVGIAFKLSLAPFHVWTPDVYEGAPLAVTAFMSVVTKVGTLAVLGRVAYASLPGEAAATILGPIWVLAALSMIVGNVAALAQTDMKRLLAYSGIAQVGYIVAAFAGTTAYGLRYAVFYLAAYTFMNLGAFAVTALLSREGDAVVGIGRFAGLAQRRPWLAGAMTFFLLALAGLPPTAGFTGKVLLLAAQVGAGYAWLAVILIAGTAVSAYVYLKIVRAMFARIDVAHVPDERPAAPLLPWLTVVVCAVLVFALGLVPFAPSNIVPALR